MASLNTYRVVCLTATVAHNFVSGTTAAPTSNATYLDKGCEVTFQNQSTGAVTVYIGGAGVVVSPAATSTSTGPFGISLAQNGSYSFGKRHAPSAINMNDWWVISTSSNAICVAQVIKAV